jgi:hypothetical protein
MDKPKKKKTLTQSEMLEKAKERPKQYTQLSPREQWEIDKELGILDWNGSDSK